MADLAKIAGTSRTYVWRLLQKTSVVTSKFDPSNPDKPCGTRLFVTCSHCGVSFQRVRSQIKGKVDMYCCAEHYYADLANPNFTQWRHGKRIARSVVSRYFNLLPDHVVHHEDSDERNNNPRNLMVFPDQANHMRWHRGDKSKAVILWDGRSADLEQRRGHV